MKKKNAIQGKRILFLAPKFFGYENKIKVKMEEMGAIVDFYNERSITKAFDRALLKITPKIFNKRTESYYRAILNDNKDKNYDYIFIVKCEMLTGDILKGLHAFYPKAVFCLYLWDSVKNIKGITEKFQYFDRILSFDSRDVQEFDVMSFRPLFYIDDFKKELSTDKKYKYDISFCGTIHSDRYAIINEVIDICKKKGLRYFTFCYLQSRFIFNLYKFLKREFKNVSESDFSFEKLSGKEISDIVDESRVILDIQHPKQSGLTMRTIEMIGMNKKLITTNADVKRYDFYNSNNILVIDRDRVKIPDGFLINEYQDIDKGIYKKYSLETWINDILFAIKC
jgi:hypothetical protein